MSFTLLYLPLLLPHFLSQYPVSIIISPHPPHFLHTLHNTSSNISTPNTTTNNHSNMCIENFTIFTLCAHRIPTSTSFCINATPDGCILTTKTVSDDPGRCKACREKRRTATRETGYRSWGVPGQGAKGSGSNSAPVSVSRSGAQNPANERAAYPGSEVNRGGERRGCQRHGHESTRHGDCFLCKIGIGRWL